MKGDATDIEKLDAGAAVLVRNKQEKSISAMPRGNDATIVGSAVGTEIPNQTDEIEAAKLQQSPPEKVIVDQEAIQRQTELFLEQQNAGLNSTAIQGIVVDGQQLEDYDELVGIGTCFLKEVINGVTQSATYTSSAEGRINIPEFGRERVLRIIPPPPFQQKDFGPNEGEDNDIDFV